MDLDNVLNGQEPEGIDTPEVELEAPAPEPQQVADDASRPRDEHGRFLPKGEENPATPEAAPPAAETPQGHVPAGALADERRKRQDLERRLAELERAPPQRQDPPQRQAQPEFIPNPVDDPQGFYDAVMIQAEQRARDALMPQIGQSRTETQRSFAAVKYPDFAETEAEYLKLIQENPALREEVARAANPVEHAYALTKNFLEVRKVGSLDVEAIKAAAIADYVAKQAPAAAPQPIPSSLADAQSSRGSAGGVGPPSLDSILGR